MSKETVYICDRCKKKGPEGFTNVVYFTYGRNWDGQENSDDDIIVDICGRCAADCLADHIKLRGNINTTVYINTQKWLMDKGIRK